MSLRISEPEVKKAEMNPIKRLYARPTRKTAINAFCSTCMGSSASEQGEAFQDHLEPGFRIEIRNCLTPACPLYDFRPYQNKAPIIKKGVQAAGT